MANSNQQPDLDDAPPIKPVDELRVLRHASSTLTAHVTGPGGLSMDVTLTDVPYDGLDGTATRALSFEKALVAKGFKTVAPVTVAPAAAQAAAAAPAPAAAVELPPVTPGGPPICSLHGAMVQRQGNNGAFWSCSNKVNGAWCRPKKAGA